MAVWKEILSWCFFLCSTYWCFSLSYYRHVKFSQNHINRWHICSRPVVVLSQTNHFRYVEIIARFNCGLWILFWLRRKLQGQCRRTPTQVSTSRDFTNWLIGIQNLELSCFITDFALGTFHFGRNFSMASNDLSLCSIHRCLDKYELIFQSKYRQ